MIRIKNTVSGTLGTWHLVFIFFVTTIAKSAPGVSKSTFYINKELYK